MQQKCHPKNMPTIKIQREKNYEFYCTRRVSFKSLLWHHHRRACWCWKLDWKYRHCVSVFWLRIRIFHIHFERRDFNELDTPHVCWMTTVCCCCYNWKSAGKKKYSQNAVSARERVRDEFVLFLFFVLLIPSSVFFLLSSHCSLFVVTSQLPRSANALQIEKWMNWINSSMWPQVAHTHTHIQTNTFGRTVRVELLRRNISFGQWQP